MYTTALAFSYVLEPVSFSNRRRTLGATLFFALGAIVGWPFSLAISIPFVFEELFVYGGDRVAPQVKSSWLTQRWTRFLTAVATASLIFVSPFIVIAPTTISTSHRSLSLPSTLSPTEG
jgi:alpha-1,2-mannosyltransferase